MTLDEMVRDRVRDRVVASLKDQIAYMSEKQIDSLVDFEMEKLADKLVIQLFK